MLEPLRRKREEHGEEETKKREEVLSKELDGCFNLTGVLCWTTYFLLDLELKYPHRFSRCVYVKLAAYPLVHSDQASLLNRRVGGSKRILTRSGMIPKRMVLMIALIPNCHS